MTPLDRRRWCCSRCCSCCSSAACGSRSRSPRWPGSGCSSSPARRPTSNLFQSFWGSSASWTLAALPLFVWMGEILFRTKLSEEMFEGLAPWLSWLPGRLMHVNILGCGIFGTVSGSSAATCATIAKVALPELKRRGYDEKTCLGSLAAAGTLGILLPPSIIMVVYAVAAEVSIIKVFLAGFIPGLRADGAVLRLHRRLGAAQSGARRRATTRRLTLREKLYRSAAPHSRAWCSSSSSSG